MSILKSPFLDNEDNRRLFSNILSLGIIQGANFLIPLLTVPYLVRVIGLEKFGLTAFATSFIAYFALVTDYGFNLSATRQVSIHRENVAKINQIFNSVLIIKAGLLILSAIILHLIILNFQKFAVNWAIFSITFGTVLGQSLLPIWLFQGMEQMKYVTYLSIGSKIFFNSCIFLFVKDESDYLVVPALTSLGAIFTGIFSLLIARKKFGIKFQVQKLDTIKVQLLGGWHIFFSNISISAYTISTTFILGLFANYQSLGLFTAADRIIQIIKGILSPVLQAIYPTVSRRISRDKFSSLNFIKKVKLIIGLFSFMTSLLVFLYAKEIISIFYGDEFINSVLLLKIMSFLPFIISLSNIDGVITMLNFGYTKAFSLILLIAAFLGVSLCFTLIPSYKEIGTAITILLVEIFVTLSMRLFLNIYMKKDL
jgi:PST family polysaccharide transporter